MRPHDRAHRGGSGRPVSRSSSVPRRRNAPTFERLHRPVVADQPAGGSRCRLTSCSNRSRSRSSTRSRGRCMGPGAHEMIGPEALKLGFKKTLVMTSGLRGTDIVHKIVESMKYHGLEVVVYDKVESNPKDYNVMDAVGLYQENSATRSSRSAAARRTTPARAPGSRWRTTAATSTSSRASTSPRTRRTRRTSRSPPRPAPARRPRGPTSSPTPRPTRTTRTSTSPSTTPR